LKASVYAKEAASSASSVAAETTAAVTEDEDDELSSFLDDLGFSEDHTPLEEDAIEENEAQSPAEPPPETEEEKAARLARVAAKRKGIMDRHTEWENKLDAAIKEHTQEVRKDLLALRKEAAADLKVQPDIRVDLDDLNAEAEKLAKGAEGYLKNLKKEKRPDADKATLWGRVIDKVENKFQTRLQETEALVNNWYAGVTQQELDIVNFSFFLLWRTRLMQIARSTSTRL
jgi:hypothetical protein